MDNDEKGQNKHIATAVAERNQYRRLAERKQHRPIEELHAPLSLEVSELGKYRRNGFVELLEQRGEPRASAHLRSLDF